MAKKGNNTIDENFMKEMISQGLPMKKEKVIVTARENAQPNTRTKPQPKKEKKQNSKHNNKVNDSDYESLFLTKLELPDRRSVYVSCSTHENLTRIANVLAKGKATVSSYIESIVQHHFDTYKDEINELYKQNINDIL